MNKQLFRTFLNSKTQTINSLEFNKRCLNSNPTSPRLHVYSSSPFHSPIEASQDDHTITKTQKPSLNSSQSITPNKSSIVTLKTIKELFEKKIPITMLTAYDFATARLIGMSNETRTRDEEETTSKFPIGIDICLCGDSLANVCLGYNSTNELGFEEFSYHLKSIRRGLDSLALEPNSRIPLLFADLPFGSFESSLEQGIQSATKLIQTSRVDGFKIEGGHEISELIKRLTSFGIPIMGHIGLTPQRASSLGGFKVQGHDDASRARKIIQDAIDLERSGCVAIVIEAVPIEIIHQLKQIIRIPLIGIGAGPHTDGQVLVLSDLIGILTSHNHLISLSKKPKFVLKDPVCLNHQPLSSDAIFDLSTRIIHNYIMKVRTRRFPIVGTHTYSMKPHVLADLNQNGWSL